MIEPRRIPLALYVHLPWCVRKCPYCDFNSHAVPAAGLPEQAYLAALIDDLEYAAAEVAGRPLVSVFFGGGTPSLFSPRAVGAVLEHANRLLPFVHDVEITLEANPGTVEHGRFVDYAAVGVNRVSLGAQSFDEAHLAVLGRIHAAGEIERAVAEVRAAGIENFNLDLMYGLPGQDVAGALADLDRAIALEPTHLSHYQLTLEPQTPFAKHPPQGMPDDELAWAIQLGCQERLAGAGFEQYEVSAYAQSGRPCRHNLVYWQFGDYVGVGAGAHGKTSTGRGIVRTARVRHPAAYLAASTRSGRLAETREVVATELPFEFCLNALRLVSGFDVALFEERTGLQRSVLQAASTVAVQRGLLVADGEWLVPTARGRQYLNDLQALFLPV